MNRVYAMLFVLTLVLCLSIFMCHTCFCETNGSGGAEETVAQDSQEVNNNTEKDDKPSSSESDSEKLKKLKELISENLPNIEKQLQEAFGSPVRLKMVDEGVPAFPIIEAELKERLKEAQSKPGNIKEKNTENEDVHKKD